MWANTIICLFSNDPESYEGMRRVLKGLNDNISIMRGKLQIEGSPIILPVLSRIPHFLTDAQKLELQETFPNKLGVEKIFMLHSDFDLQTESFLPISPEGEIKNVQLVHDYLNLFATACPEVADSPDIETKVTYLWNALGFPGKPETIDETYRVFRLRNSQSIMMNLSDNQRNVSFKVETFCAILNDIHRGLVETTHESLTEVEQSFYHAGSLAGANFGKSLMREIWSDPDNMPVKNRLDDWCRFDSGVGFGFMKSTELGENNASGKIVVKDNFLVNNRNRDEANLCSLFSGYIAGVLGEILDFEVDVVHEQSLCMRFTHGQESCVFCFSRKNIIEETGVE
jgi:predicted hydrocarbon binding protein